jgi:hypothetical protein
VQNLVEGELSTKEDPSLSGYHVFG